MLVVGNTRWEFRIQESRSVELDLYIFKFILDPEFEYYHVGRQQEFSQCIFNDQPLGAGSINFGKRIRVSPLAGELRVNAFTFRETRDRSRIIEVGCDELARTFISTCFEKEIICDKINRVFDKAFLIELVKSYFARFFGTIGVHGPFGDFDLLNFYEQEMHGHTTNVQRFRGNYVFTEEMIRNAIDTLTRIGEPGIFKDKAGDKALELLYSKLNEDELKEAKEKKQITIHTITGIFIVRLIKHALVRQYSVDLRNYIQSHCVVFNDYGIPMGDEVLMKLILIKKDLNRFMALSNKRVEPNIGALVL